MRKWLGLSNYTRALRPALEILNKVGNGLALPEYVREGALKLYKQCIARSLTRGRKRIALMSACIYVSCQGFNYPVGLNKLCKASQVSKSELVRSKKFIKRFIKLSEGVVEPGAYVSRYCYELGLGEGDVTDSLIYLKKLKLVNKSSQALAVTSIYFTGKSSIRKLARVSGLSKSYVWECIKMARA